MLKDDSIVVWGGTPAKKKLDNACDHHEGHHGFSAQCANDKDSNALAKQLPYGHKPFGKIGSTTVGNIRNLGDGFDVVKTSGKFDHVSVVVPEDMTDEQKEALIDLFEISINPQLKEWKDKLNAEKDLG